VIITDVKYVEQLIKDYTKGDLTLKEFVEQVAEVKNGEGYESKMLEFVEKSSIEKIGHVFKEHTIATIVDCNWEGYQESERVAIVRYWEDILTAVENGLLAERKDGVGNVE
jgi:hypothetical protein